MITIEQILSDYLIGRTIIDIDGDITLKGKKIVKVKIGTGQICGVSLQFSSDIHDGVLLPFDQYSKLNLGLPTK